MGIQQLFCFHAETFCQSRQRIPVSYTHLDVYKRQVVEGLVWGCIHSFTSVLFVKALFDEIGAGAPFSDILVLVGLMAAFFIAAYIFHEWYWQHIEPTARQTLHERMQSVLFRKALGLDLACYDNPDFYTDFVWAINEADSRAVWVAEDMGKLINRVVSTACLLYTSQFLWCAGLFCPAYRL